MISELSLLLFRTVFVLGDFKYSGVTGIVAGSEVMHLLNFGGAPDTVTLVGLLEFDLSGLRSGPALLLLKIRLAIDYERLNLLPPGGICGCCCRNGACICPAGPRRMADFDGVTSAIFSWRIFSTLIWTSLHSPCICKNSLVRVFEGFSLFRHALLCSSAMST